MKSGTFSVFCDQLNSHHYRELRASLDTLRTETEKQASYHLTLAQQVRNDMEGQTTAFLNRQLQHKKGPQAAIDREYKMKQQQEAHVNRAREK